MKVSVFGSSQPEPNSPIYVEAYQLGKSLAKHGHTVMTGGYYGLMEAVSRGAYECGGYVIGVTCQEIENWRLGGANAWIGNEQRKETLLERLQLLCYECDAAIVMEGGAGTLTEFALTWNLMVIEAVPQKPLILIGDAWRSVVDQIFKSMGEYVSTTQQAHVTCVPDGSAAIRMLELGIAP